MTEEEDMLVMEVPLDGPSRKRILRERAIELARPPAVEEGPAALSDFIVFNLAGESYGIEAGCVRQVCPAADLLALPCTPPFIAGVLSVRGEVVAIMDLKAFFEIPSGGMIEAREAILVHANDLTFGFLADSVAGLRSIPLQSLQPVSSPVSGRREEYLKGIVAGMLVLDVARIATDRRLIVKEEVEDEVIGWGAP
jgi:purine-binding chemotaxis protein CheW